MPPDTLFWRRREQWLLALMLVVLHASLWSEFGSLLSRSLMLAHLGLFLIWQPLWRRDQRLDRGTAVVFVLLTLGFVYWLNWWFVFVWLVLLIGLIGGMVFKDRRERFIHLLTLAALSSELLVGCTISMFAVPISGELRALFGYGLLVPPLLLFVIPAREAPAGERLVDFLHGLTTSLLISILALGSLLVMYSSGESYFTSMFQTLTSIAVFLFAIGWLLTPHPGFTGFSQVWGRYLMNVGITFEDWLTDLARTARAHQGPREFLDEAMAQVARLPWVQALRWRSPSGEGQAGTQTRHFVELRAEDVDVTLYTRRPASTALLLHSRLLIQVIGYFYQAKRAQQELARQAHLQAIYETGARVTHDIKNLLQSLQTMSLAVQHAQGTRAAEVQQLLQRQLPHLSQRLQLALDKLQSPVGGTRAEVALSQWWQAFGARHAGQDIGLEAEIEADPQIPGECFDSVAENLLENARKKRQQEPGLAIAVRLTSRPGELTLTVCDDGSPVPAETSRALFREPVSSRTGLGIGLYQAARQAEQLGYGLSLARNEAGRVCFCLAARASRPPAT
jgi:signal transduction histidine kinase